MRMLTDAQWNFAFGMNDSAAPDAFNENEVSLIENGRVSFNGQAIERRGGSQLLNAAGGGPRRNTGSALSSGDGIKGSFAMRDASGTQYKYAIDNGEICEGNNALDTTENYGVRYISWAGVEDGAFCQFYVFRQGSDNIVLVAPHITHSEKLTYLTPGGSTTFMANMPAGVQYMAIFNDRLWVAGHDGVEVAASKVGDVTTWAVPDGFTVNAQGHSQETDTEIMGLFPLGSILLVFKRYSVGYIEGFGYNTLSVEAGERGISRSVGCIAPRSIKQCGDNGVMWLSERGFEYFDPQSGIQLVSQATQNFVDSLNYDAIKETPALPVALWWPEKHEYWCAVPRGRWRGTHVNKHDAIWVFRPPTQAVTPCTQTFIMPEYTQFPTVDGDGYLDLTATPGNFAYVDREFPSTSSNDDGTLQINGATTHYWADYGDGTSTPGTAYGRGEYLGTDELSYLDFGTQMGVTSLHVEDTWITTLANEAYAQGGGPQRPIMGSSDCMMREMEWGVQDNSKFNTLGGSGSQQPYTVTATVRSRPFVLGAPATRKRMRHATVQMIDDDRTSADSDYTVTITPYADGVAETARTQTYAQTYNNMPVSKTVRVKAKGESLQIEAQWSKWGAKLQGFECRADILKDML